MAGFVAHTAHKIDEGGGNVSWLLFGSFDGPGTGSDVDDDPATSVSSSW